MKRLRNWFDANRGIAVTLGIGVLLGIGIFGRPVVGQEPVSERVRQIAEGLRTTSVYEEKPGVPGVVDAERARQLLGDRPIVLALLDDTPLPSGDRPWSAVSDLCDEIASVVTTSLVIVYATNAEGEYDQAYCAGPEFSNPENPVDVGNYDFVLIGRAERAWKYRVSDEDRFPEVEEFVFAFDEQAAQDYPDGVPRRAVVVPPPPAPDKLQTTQLALSFGGVLLGPVALFALLRFVASAASRRGGRAADSRTRYEAAGTRLNRLANAVLHPPAPTDAAAAQRQADLAERYVLLLRDYEAARTRTALADVERQLEELEREAAT